MSDQDSAPTTPPEPVIASDDEEPQGSTQPPQEQMDTDENLVSPPIPIEYMDIGDAMENQILTPPPRPIRKASKSFIRPSGQELPETDTEPPVQMVCDPPPPPPKSRDRSKHRPENSDPINPTHPENINRREVEAIINQLDGDKEADPTEEQILRLRTALKDWRLNPGFKHKGKECSGFSAQLKAINKKRTDLLKKYDAQPPTERQRDRLQREIIKTPNLARYKETKEEIKKDSKFRIPIKKQIVPTEKANQTFFPKMTMGSSKRCTQPPGRKKPQQQPTAHSSSDVPDAEPAITCPDEVIQTARPPTPCTSLQPSTVPPCPPTLPTVQPIVEEPVYQILVTSVPPPFQDSKTKCTLPESYHYFRDIAKEISEMDDKWLLGFEGADPILDNLRTVVPPEILSEMRHINDSNNKLAIAANNAALVDSLTQVFVSCLVRKVFNPTQKLHKLSGDVIEGHFDLRNTMNEIITAFSKTIKEGIWLPPLMTGHSNPIKRRIIAIPRNQEPGIEECEIPEGLHDMYREIIGKPGNGQWRSFQNKVITNNDALEFLPGNSLSSKTFETLVSKILHNRANVTLILWSEIEKLKSITSTGEFDTKTECTPIIEHLTDRIKGAKDYIFIPICPSSNFQFGFALAKPNLKKIYFFIPEQPTMNLPTWEGRDEQRLNFGQNLYYILQVVEEIHKEVGDWCLNDLQWPYNSFFELDDNIKPSDNIKMSPIYSILWLERQLDSQVNRVVNSEETIDDEDARRVYFKLLEDKNL